MAPLPPEAPGQYSNESNIWEQQKSLLPATATIKELYPAVMNERPDSLRTAAEGWKALSTQLHSTKTDLKTDRETLAPQWTSSAATPFLAWITNSEESLEDWKTSADQNVTKLLPRLRVFIDFVKLG